MGALSGTSGQGSERAPKQGRQKGQPHAGQGQDTHSGTSSGFFFLEEVAVEQSPENSPQRAAWCSEPLFSATNKWDTSTGAFRWLLEVSFSKGDVMTDQQGKRQAESDETAFDVSELFSAPRMCPVAEQQGFDIEHTDRVTGKSWDLADSREHIRLWSLLRRRSQKLFIVSPPATKFSSVQHSRRGPTRRTPQRPQS